MKESVIQSKLDKIISLIKDQTDKPMSFRDTCKYLKISSSYLYKLTSSKKINFYKPSGKLIYFKKSEIDSWVFENSICTRDEIKEQIKKSVSENTKTINE